MTTSARLTDHSAQMGDAARHDLTNTKNGPAPLVTQRPDPSHVNRPTRAHSRLAKVSNGAGPAVPRGSNGADYMVATATRETSIIDRSACPSTGGHGTRHYRDKRGCTCPDAREDALRLRRGLRYGQPALPRQVHPIGPCRRLQAAAVAGWGLRPLSAVTGMTPTTLSHIRQGARRHYVRADRAEAIRVAVGELLTRTPPTGYAATRTRALAARQEWLPLGVWDNIDDPDEVPDLRHLRRDRPRRRDVVVDAAELVEQGEHVERVTERTGLSPEAQEIGVRRVRARRADRDEVA